MKRPINWKPRRALPLRQRLWQQAKAAWERWGIELLIVAVLVLGVWAWWIDMGQYSWRRWN